MKLKWSAALLPGLLVSLSLFAQSSPLPSPSAAPDAAELTRLLNDFLAGASRHGGFIVPEVRLGAEIRTVIDHRDKE